MSEAADRVVVVGAGISGVACARVLRAAGVPVRLVDRGRRPGGRMSSRELSGRPVDLGASYLTVSDPDFQAVVDAWETRGVVRSWTDTFSVLGDSTPELKQGPMRYGAAGGIGALVTDLASGLEVERLDVGHVDELATPAGMSAVVLAMPDPQARRLLGADHPLVERLDRTFEPVLALAVEYAERSWDGLSPSGRFDGAFVNDHPVLAWVADDGRRRGDDAPVLVAHSTPDFARLHLADPAAAAPAITDAVREVMHLDQPLDVHLHRWSFARPTGSREDRYLLADVSGGLVGVCGDGWGPSPKVETAWRSGRDLGRALVDRVGQASDRRRS